MIASVMLWSLVLPYYAISVFVRSEVFVFYRRPDLARIEVFASLSHSSASVTAIFPFLFTGPVYSLLFFAASVDKDVLLSYPFLFNKFILRRAVSFPDPSPGIDLSTLTPVPVRRRLYKRVIRKSRQYDPPLSFLDYDIPLPPRPDPGFRTMARLPPVPELPKPEKIHVDPRSREGRSMQDRPRRGSRVFEEAIRRHIETRDDRPLYTISETPVVDDGLPLNYFFGPIVPLSREDVENSV
ncbi:hypothetical protein DFH11DRAFT_130899 [Phellopilus nigrolimitatus]|nr:hypothetical protein DFH11DRAFT_130899 [Phellopilus nigrolimitatus]